MTPVTTFHFGACLLNKGQVRCIQYYKKIWHWENRIKKCLLGGFPGGSVVENLPANAGDTGSSPGLGRSHMPRSN